MVAYSHIFTFKKYFYIKKKSSTFANLLMEKPGIDFLQATSLQATSPRMENCYAIFRAQPSFNKHQYKLQIKEKVSFSFVINVK